MENQSNPNNQSAPDFYRTAAVTAVKTVYAVVVSVALVCTLIVFLFPFGAMQFYLELNNRHRALESAESYLKQYPEEGREWDSRYAGVLYRAAQLAGDLFADATGSRKEFYAEKTVELTERYFTVDSVSMKNEQIDAFNVGAAVNPMLHPGLYSIADHLTVTAYRANLYLDKSTAIVWTRDRELPLDVLLNSTLATANFELTDDMLLPWMTVFNQLSAYIDTVFAEIGVTPAIIKAGDNALGDFAATLNGNHFDLFYTLGQNKGFTKLYTLLTDQFSVFSDFVNRMSRDSAAAALKQCYCVKTVSGFATRMDTVTYILYAQGYPIEVSAEAWKTWRANDVYRYGEGELDYYYMSSYYTNTLLPTYVQLYNEEKLKQ